jgi:hypothetical protein
VKGDWINGNRDHRNCIAHVFGNVSCLGVGNCGLRGGGEMKDGVALMYIKDGILYPVALTQEQYDILQFTARLFEPLKIIDKPQGKAVNLLNKKS